MSLTVSDDYLRYDVNTSSIRVMIDTIFFSAKTYFSCSASNFPSRERIAPPSLAYMFLALTTSIVFFPLCLLLLDLTFGEESVILCFILFFKKREPDSENGEALTVCLVFFSFTFILIFLILILLLVNLDYFFYYYNIIVSKI